MINLLPPEAKRPFAAGRLNSMLIRYIWITLLLCGLIGILSAFTSVTLDVIKQSAQTRINENLASVSNLSGIQQRADAFRTNLAVSKAILDQQTHYTDTLLKITSLMTPGTTLNNITLDESTYGTPMSLQVNAKTEQDAIALKQSFQSSPLFSDVHFLSLTLSNSTNQQAGSAYPVNAQLVVTIKKGA